MATSDIDQNINAQLFKELSDRFPGIPKDVISNTLRMTGNDRTKCLQDLEHQGQIYNRGQQTPKKVMNYWPAPSAQAEGVTSPGAGTLGLNTGQTTHVASSASLVQPKDFELYTSDTSNKPSNIPNINCMHSSVNTGTPSVQEAVRRFENVRNTSGVRQVPVVHINSPNAKPVDSGQTPPSSNTPCISYRLKSSGSSGGTCYVVDRTQSTSYSPLHISTETSTSSLNRPREGFSTTKTIMINQPFNGQNNTMKPVTNSVSVFDRQGTNSSIPIQETSYAQEEHSNNIRYNPMNDSLSSASNHGMDNVRIKPAPPIRPGGMKEEEEYIRALLHHQEQRYENLMRDYKETKEQTIDLKREVAQMEMNLLLNSARRNSFPTIEDVTKLREENRRLQTDIQCMSNEVDMSTHGQYGLVDPVEQQNFYQNMPTGPTGPIGKLSDPPIPLPRKPAVQRPIDMNQVPPVPPRQSSAGSGDSEEGEHWNCSACTFLNHPALNKCECCEMPRIGS